MMTGLSNMGILFLSTVCVNGKYGCSSLHFAPPSLSSWQLGHWKSMSSAQALSMSHCTNPKQGSHMMRGQE
ncbi:hypothetical protein F5J12DRAFT_854788 [Pisolithus orientalis]|uniref:uncharacterized protein n=1 Tax=Pisolithus orientalis TaxID=936130 RepID=UPI0022240862|nr:uncharacterized protein F5J12DRAFT_854788 [Pisolithus orientalis]KAI5996030.1 hypothetical protein F5J12DRAFT_854788 [Pisolithus orientalis]